MRLPLGTATIWALSTPLHGPLLSCFRSLLIAKQPLPSFSSSFFPDTEGDTEGDTLVQRVWFSALVSAVGGALRRALRLLKSSTSPSPTPALDL